jgi:serine phosphatase RsbU (regulator of sigma subunit)
MESRSSQFVLRILVIHGLLLLIVLALVAYASEEIYSWTRNDAQAQARVRQELLADLTRRNIITFYDNILHDLDWIQRTPANPGRGGANPGSARQGPNAGNGRGAAFRDRTDENVVSQELGGRVSALFAYNKADPAVQPILPKDSKLSIADLSPDITDWLRTVDQTKVSRLFELKGIGVSLVAASFGPNDPLLLVAVVPGKEIESNYLKLMNDQNSAGVSLIDSGMRVITSTNSKLAGMNLDQFQNADLLDMIHTYQQHPKITTRAFTEPLVIGDVNLEPRMITLAPVNIAQEHWMLFLAQPMSNIDASITPLFTRTLYWAAFLAASITAVLVSTSLQLIRAQSRLDRERRRSMEREILQARRIQQQWLPEMSSAPEGLDVAAINQPANQISGDFYNWFALPDGRSAIVIGDVTGHGMTAAFLMATTQLLVRNILYSTPDPGRAMEEVNRQLSSQMFRGQFVTMLIIAVDLEKKEIEVASAGHPAPLVLQNGKVYPLDSQAQLVLGIERDVQYPTQRFSLPEASGLLLYTDGVIDAIGSGDERFGLRRVVHSLNSPLPSAREMIGAVTAAVKQFRGPVDLHDDLTLVAIQWKKTATPSTEDSQPPSEMRLAS